MPFIIKLLCFNNPIIVDLSVLILGNIAYGIKKPAEANKDAILNPVNVLNVFHENVNENVCFGCIEFNQHEMLKKIAECFKNSNIHIKQEALKLIRQISDGDESQKQAIIDANIISLIEECLDSLDSIDSAIVQHAIFSNVSLPQISRNVLAYFDSQTQQKPTASISSGEKSVNGGDVAYQPDSSPAAPEPSIVKILSPIHTTQIPSKYSFLINPEVRCQPSLRVKTLYSCTAEHETELSFEPGQIITNVDESKQEGWIVGRLNGKTGLIPANYVEPLPEPQ